MFDIKIEGRHDSTDDLKPYLVDTLGLGDDTADAILDGDTIHVTTVDTRQRAEEIQAQLEERGADTIIDEHPVSHIVSGTVTFDGDQPAPTVSIAARNVFPPTDQRLGSTELGSNQTYTIEYEAAPSRTVDLVVEATAEDTTLVQSEPIVDASPEEVVDLTVPKQTMPVAASTQGNDLFDFMLVRPPGSADDGAVDINQTVGESRIIQALSDAKADGDRAGMIESAASYMRSDAAVEGVAGASEPLATLDQRLDRTSTLNESRSRQLVEDSFGMPPEEVVDSDEFQHATQRMSDSLTALSVIPGGDGDTRRQLSRGMKIAELIRDLAGGRVDDPKTVLKRPVAMPDDVFPLPEPITTSPNTDVGSSSAGTEVPQEVVDLYEELRQIRAAKEELLAVDQLTSGLSPEELPSDLPTETSTQFDAGRSIAEQVASDLPTGDGDDDGPEDESDFDTSIDGSDDDQFDTDGDSDTTTAMDTDSTDRGMDTDWSSTERPFRMLSEEATETINAVTPRGSPTGVVDTVDRLAETETEVETELLQSSLGMSSGRSVQLGNSLYTLSGDHTGGTGTNTTVGTTPGLADTLRLDGIKQIPDFGYNEWGDGSELFDTPLVNVLGVGEMKTVKKETARYEMGELAHIENVLDGEVKERVHEREEVTEETIISERETTESQKHDLQTSEQFEMERETEETVKEKSSVEAGVNVSASYGPTIQVDAYADYSRSQSSKESTRAARRYSREVTKETVNRIKRRKLRRRVKRMKERVTETNTHRLDNTDDDGNLSGIYRWVDRILKAQVFEHGRRLMLEFIVPEPAAFYRIAKSSNPADQVMVEKPDPPRYLSFVAKDNRYVSKERPLQPGDITQGNYQLYAQQYGATDVSPPPEPIVRETAKLTQDGKQSKGPQNGNDNESASRPFYKQKNIPIKDGYRPVEATVTFADVVRNKTDWWWKLQAVVGNSPVSVGWRGTWELSDPVPEPGNAPNPKFVQEVRKQVQEETAQNIVKGKIRSATRDVLNRLDGSEDVKRIVDEIAKEIEDETFFGHDMQRLREGVQDAIETGIEPWSGTNYSSAERTYENQLEMEDGQRPIALDRPRDDQGSTDDDSRSEWGIQTVSLANLPSGKNDEVPLTVFGYNLLGFAVSVEVKCHRTERAMENWRLETYKKIITAYKNKLAEYRTAVEEADAEGGIDIEGNPPEENRRIEREELKRLAISMMRRKHVNVDALKDDIDEVIDGDIPGVNFDALPDSNRTIQFFEQAFEWHDMTYIFYPYFWTDRERWTWLEQLDANDPAFESFLSAGAARVVVPVKPGYFNSVLWYLQSHELKFDPPDIGEKRHVPIISEIKEKQGLDEDAEADGKPWAVRTPTELVKLQQSQELPDLPPDVDTGR